jgi:hypothetical protein
LGTRRTLEAVQVRVNSPDAGSIHDLNATHLRGESIDNGRVGATQENNIRLVSVVVDDVANDVVHKGGLHALFERASEVGRDRECLGPIISTAILLKKNGGLMLTSPEDSVEGVAVWKPKRAASGQKD